ncbi:MAG TPA: ferritin-like domain-containing protein, partial [Parafilimonas sp.]|nr:ferritin-like domain-containing protein [Parafilimonas sp.]
MNLNNIFTQIEKTDPEVYDRMDSRRSAIRNVGSKIALTAVPFLLGGMFKKAYAGDKKMSSVSDVLNFALTLEYLEASFYRNANKTNGLITDNDAKKTFSIIGQHEIEHVAFLTTTIAALGKRPVSEPKFDYTAGGAFPTVFSDYDTFLAVSQTFEDTGVRAYKGQVTNVMSSDTILSAAVRIHSVEARHASKVRQLRSEKYAKET